MSKLSAFIFAFCCLYISGTAFAVKSYDASSNEFNEFVSRFEGLADQLEGSQAYEFIDRIRALGYLNYEIIEGLGGYVQAFLEHRELINPKPFIAFQRVALRLQKQLEESERIAPGEEQQLLREIMQEWIACETSHPSHSVSSSGGAASSADSAESAAAAAAAAANSTVPPLRTVGDEEGVRASPRETRSARTPRVAISPRVLELRGQGWMSNRY